jgi:hypothetical protein
MANMATFSMTQRDSTLSLEENVLYRLEEACEYEGDSANELTLPNHG